MFSCVYNNSALLYVSCQIPGTGTFPRISSTTARAWRPSCDRTASSLRHSPRGAKSCWTYNEIDYFEQQRIFLDRKSGKVLLFTLWSGISTDSFQGFERFDTEFPSPSALIWHKSIPYLYEDLRSSLFGSILESVTQPFVHIMFGAGRRASLPSSAIPGGPLMVYFLHYCENYLDKFTTSCKISSWYNVKTLISL
jgi:hypothetical protein